MEKKFNLIAQAPGLRLDVFLAQETSLPRAQIQRLIRDGLATVNGQKARPSLRLRSGDRVDLALPPPTPTALTPEAMPLSIVYEDADILVVDKPPGLTVHPAPGHPSHTLVNALLAHLPYLPGAPGSQRPGIVHRLDKDTSGLLIVAKTEAARMKLAQQMKARAIGKDYLVLVKGRLTPERGAIEAPIGRHPHHRQKMAVVATGRAARTGYRVIRYLGDYTLVEASLETGRTHQIRVHFSAIGHPVAGDAVYGVKVPFLGRQFLHAHRLRFHHPISGELLELTSPLPPDLAAALGALSEPK